jgi:hypothetical protein
MTLPRLHRPIAHLGLLLLLTLIASLPWQDGAAAITGPALVYVQAASSEQLARFQSTGLPAYARLSGSAGGVPASYLLVGADQSGLEALAAAGLPHRILDLDSRGASYYLAYPRPGRAQTAWQDYGRLLLADGAQFLLRLEPGQAERLLRAKVELRALQLNPKPLRPALAPGSIPAIVEPDPLIQIMIDQVSEATVYDYTGGLSGEWPVDIGGSPYTIQTRNTYSGTPIQKATQYAGEHLEDLGMAVEYHTWSGLTYPNVIGEIQGALNPEQIYMVTAHLDDMPSGPIAPGADDNASGSVAILIAADILSQYQWGCTLRFALWTGEEQGLLGSHAYAQRAFNQGEDIAGVLNLDMIGWNTPGSSRDIELHATSDIPSTLELAQLFVDVLDAYNINLIPQINPNGTGASDHASFWDYGYTAILGIEDFGDFNPRYHTTGDQLQYLDIAYFTDFVRASVGTFAHMSGCLIPSGLGYLNGHVSSAETGAPLAQASVTATDSYGHTVTTLTDATGYYTRTLPSDTYTVTASAYAYMPLSEAAVPVFTDTITTQDFALQLAPTYVVSGTVHDAVTGLPLFAHLSFDDIPVTAWSDPQTGFYQVHLLGGVFTMHVRSRGHQTVVRTIVVDADQTQNFHLETRPCLLLVDDDQNAPNIRSYYTLALDSLGHSYAVWDVSSAGGPSVDDLTGYDTLIWATGQPAGNTLSAADEAAASAYLNFGGGHLLLSSQDYLRDVDPPSSFSQNYLGLVAHTDDTNKTDPTGVAGDPIGDGLGPYNLIKPSGWSALRTDDASGAQGSPFRWNLSGQANSTRYEGANFKTVFLAWPLETVNSLAARLEILQAILGYFDSCQPAKGTLVGQVTASDSGIPLAGAQVSVAPGGLPSQLTGPSGTYAFTLPGGLYTVTASADWYVTATVQNVLVQPDLTSAQDFALDPLPPTLTLTPAELEVALVAGDTASALLLIGNAGNGSLTFTLTDTLASPWLELAPTAGSLLAGQTSPITLTFDTAGLANSLYTTTLAVASNDPLLPLALVPLTMTIHPACLPPSGVAFGWRPADPVAGSPITFTASATGTLPLTYTWDFASGDPVSGLAPWAVHTYPAAGQYSVTLTVSNPCGLDQVIQEVPVAAPPPRNYLPLIFME